MESKFKFSLLVPTSREPVETIHYVLNDSSKMDSMLSLGDYDYILHSLELLLHKKCKGCHTLLIKLYYFNWIEIVVAYYFYLNYSEIRNWIKYEHSSLWKFHSEGRSQVVKKERKEEKACIVILPKVDRA